MEYIAALIVVVLIFYVVKINKKKIKKEPTVEPKTAKAYYPNKSSIITATRSKPTRMKDESEDVLLNAYIASNLLDTSSDDDRSYNSRNDYRDYSSDNDYSRSSSYSSSYGGDSSSSSSSSSSDSSSSSSSSSSD